MSEISVWHHFAGQVGATQKRSILNSLTNVGILTHALASARPSGPGILFFDQVTEHLREFVHDASHGGLQRILCVAVSRCESGCAGAWQLRKAGASDVLRWSRSSESAMQVFARFERWNQVDEIIHSPLVSENLAGQSPAWIRALRQAVEGAQFTDVSILIMGETGTGKELIAKLIHTLDARPHKRNLVLLDCATIVPELSGSEFFGHERGAFTGAVSARDGAFALANGGSLFLDEVGELPTHLQAGLLRAVQEHSYKRVGGNKWQQTDFRLICATNRELLAEQAHGHFRSDFYYRIAGWTCRLPPIRERGEDILVLTKHFIEELCEGDPLELDDAVGEYLLTREYPGNVRDLKQLLTRIVRRHVGPGPITIGDIPDEEISRSESERFDWRGENLENTIRMAVAAGASLKEIERAAGEIAERIVLKDVDGSLQRAAVKLGITDRALQMRRATRRQNGKDVLKDAGSGLDSRTEH
jgi:transcriptional regulator with GAF, ATPase, and Fis domain